MHLNNKVIFLVFVLVIAAFGYMYFNSTGEATRYDFECIDADGTDAENVKDNEWDDSYYVASYITYNDRKLYDGCVEKRLRERYCDSSGSEQQTKLIKCPTGYECRSGSCKLPI